MQCKRDNDATSVTLKIEELQKEPFNPVLLYKQQGCSSSSKVEVFAAVTYFKVLLSYRKWNTFGTTTMVELE